ncbi:unnamed protein product [Allacma fusca]|uniref:Tetratricopeptide SHNi-TPR domain-containing protein n=1 Tax=Allacma fusca TaxID=39272 RepID=A0A8J2JHL6_9HEXA|nr:unnamed protein product [Allacma fusca]
MVQEQETTPAVEKMSESPVKTAATAEAASAETPGSSTSPSTDKEENVKKALNALIQGKRHMLIKDTVHACAALGEACRLFTEVYGPLAREHAEAHFFYGKALLDQARAELAVFEAPAADAKSDEDTEESGEDEEEEEEEEEGEGSSEKKKADEGKKEEEAKVEAAEPVKEKEPNAEEDLNVPSPAEANGQNGSTTMEADEEQPSTSKGPADETLVDPGEDLSSLELAWEVLEIAKLSYCKQIEELEGKLKGSEVENRETQEETLKQLKQRLAESNSLLGEVGTESENYPQAIEDFKTSLAMYTEFESPDSREIAQVHFHIGVAHGLAKTFQDSIDSFKKSVEIIRQRIENLKKKVEKEKPEGETLVAIQNEIKELTELLPELEERINDTLEQEKEAMKSAEEEKMEEEIIQRNSPVKNPNPPAANDISHLVKKRKKEKNLPQQLMGIPLNPFLPPVNKFHILKKYLQVQVYYNFRGTFVGYSVTHLNII